MKLSTKKRSVLLLCLLLLLGTGCKAATPAPSSATTSTPPSTKETAAPSEVASSQSTETVQTASQAPLQIAALKGPTAMGMAQLIQQTAEKGDIASYQFAIVASPDEIVPLIAQGKADIAAVPANLASVLYHRTQKKIKVLAINTLGVLYLVENGDEIHSLADLKGKTIYAAGKGATPEYALHYVLQSVGLEEGKDVTVEFKSEHTQCVSLLSQDSHAIALLPQPFVSAAMLKNPKIRIAVDLNEAWENAAKKTGDPSSLITGVLIARSDVLEKSPEAVRDFLEAYHASVNFVNSNTAEAAQMIGKLDIVPAPVAEKALPYCNITYLDGQTMKSKLSGYVNVLFHQNPQAVGGSLPGDDFYGQP